MPAGPHVSVLAPMGGTRTRFTWVTTDWSDRLGNSQTPLAPHYCGGMSSATGTRARVARVRAEYPGQLDYSGCWNQNLEMEHRGVPSAPSPEHQGKHSSSWHSMRAAVVLLSCGRQQAERASHRQADGLCGQWCSPAGPSGKMDERAPTTSRSHADL